MPLVKFTWLLAVGDPKVKMLPSGRKYSGYRAAGVEVAPLQRAAAVERDLQRAADGGETAVARPLHLVRTKSLGTGRWYRWFAGSPRRYMRYCR